MTSVNQEEEEIQRLIEKKLGMDFFFQARLSLFP